MIHEIKRTLLFLRRAKTVKYALSYNASLHHQKCMGPLIAKYLQHLTCGVTWRLQECNTYAGHSNCQQTLYTPTGGGYIQGCRVVDRPGVPDNTLAPSECSGLGRSVQRLSHYDSVILFQFRESHPTGPTRAGDRPTTRVRYTLLCYTCRPTYLYVYRTIQESCCHTDRLTTYCR